MTTLIRRAESGDTESICRADARAFGDGPYGEARDKTNHSNWREQRIERLREWYRDHYRETFVAVVDGKVVRINVSAKAIRNGLIVKPHKRDYTPPAEDTLK